MAAALDVAALKATVQGEAALQAAVSVHEVGGGVEAAAHETRGARDPRCTRPAVHETRGARGGGVHEAVALEVAAHEVAAHEVAAHEAVVTAAARRSRRGARGGGER